MALMVLLAMALVFIQFNPLGVAKPLEDVEVVDCDGKTSLGLQCDNKRADPVRAGEISCATSVMKPETRSRLLQRT
jgi:hypothetical protein